MDDSDIPRSQWETMIDEWIFSERDRKIIKRRLLDGICYEPLAEEMSMSSAQIKRITKKCIAILSKHLK